MRNIYLQILKRLFHDHLVHTRTTLGLTQAQMAERLLIDLRSYSNLDHEKSMCGTLTFVLFLLYCCPEPLAFLEEIRTHFDEKTKHVA